ncbi:hypothetical protein HELRODRAFT_179997 [Helobdella robusta]|uniref:Peptidase M12B domain-containing protein n=1 Tax=Helobdella robusta TaxID=6412 RepID=T1FFB4_HELRO|nr:hypothetical protein HELRODRAFT_179997 [Helobdella robusta]ESN94892.1 hypothetical protein HELRODRAFT_179997 [Helobdella robusta]
MREKRFTHVVLLELVSVTAKTLPCILTVRPQFIIILTVFIFTQIECLKFVNSHRQGGRFGAEDVSIQEEFNLSFYDGANKPVDSDEINGKNHTSLKIQFINNNNTQFQVFLRLSRKILASNFAVYIVGEHHKRKNVHKLKLDCHYQGHVDGNQSQVAVLSLCSSVNGFYQKGNEVFEVISKQKGSLDAVVVKKVDVPRSSFCGVRNTLMASRQNLKNVKKLVTIERNVTATLDREIRIVKIFVAIDHEVYSFFQSDANFTTNYLLNAFTSASLYYQEQDILITIAALEIWGVPNIVLKPTATQHDLLDLFERYNEREIISNFIGIDTSMLVTLVPIDSIHVFLK